MLLAVHCHVVVKVLKAFREHLRVRMGPFRKSEQPLHFYSYFNEFCSTPCLVARCCEAPKVWQHCCPVCWSCLPIAAPFHAVLWF